MNANPWVVIDVGAFETRFGFGGETCPRDKFRTVLRPATQATEMLPVDPLHLQIASAIASPRTFPRLRKGSQGGPSTYRIYELPAELCKRIVSCIEPDPPAFQRLSDHGRQANDWLIGEYAISAGRMAERTTLELQSPCPPLLFSGRYENFDALESIYEHVFLELKVSSEEVNVVLPISVLSDKHAIERKIQILFEVFSVSSILLATIPYFSLLACTPSQQSGVVVDVGENVFTITPIYQGQILPHALRARIGHGHALNRFALEEQTFESQTPLSLMERLVPSDTRKRFSVKGDRKDNGTPSQELVEQLFFSNDPQEPENCTRDHCDRSNLPLLIKECIEKCDQSIRSILWSNIVLVGGTSKMTNFGDRFEQELRNVAPHSIQDGDWNVTHGNECSTFFGGSLLSQCNEFMMEYPYTGYQDYYQVPIYAPKEVFDEIGPPIIRRKRCG